jgi:SAM-dependent methyltransferase
MAGEAGSSTYALGHSERELNRLRVQARLVDPITRRFLVEAGIRRGMRVLDVGSGVGDAAFLVAEFVGADGEVVGTDRSDAALAVARRRAAERSLRNVSFREGDPAGMTFEEPFDAVVGRYVLNFQPDPAGMLRKLVTHVRTGGLVVFHEPYRGPVRSYPPVAAYDEAWELVNETGRRLGADPLFGLKLHATFIAAGLPAPTMRFESVIAGGATSADHVHFEMDLVPTLATEMERLGVVAAGELDAVETLADQVIDEVAATESVVVGRGEVAAWSLVTSPRAA